MGPSCLMYDAVPYIPSPPVPAGDLGGKEQYCHVLVLRMPRKPQLRGFCRSLHVERLSALVDRPVTAEATQAPC